MLADAQFSETLNFPAVNATAYSSAFRFGTVAGTTNLAVDNIWRTGRVKIQVPALTAHTDTSKNITFWLQDAAEVATKGSNPTATAGTLSGWADCNPLEKYSLPGVTSGGSLAQVVELHLPIRPRGPIRVACNVPSADGDSSASTFTVNVFTLE